MTLGITEGQLEDCIDLLLQILASAVWLSSHDQKLESNCLDRTPG